MDRFNSSLQPSSYPPGGAGATPAPTHEDRLQRLEQRVQQLSDELNAVAESHATRIARLESQVG